MKSIAYLMGALCMIVNSQAAFSQAKFELINSGKIIDEGIALHDNGKYDAAIARYNQIGRNDTNYVYSLTERSYSELASEKYDACIATIHKIFSASKHRNPEMFINLGTALDESGKKEEAIKAYEDGIAIFPMNHLLHFNKAVTQFKLEKYDEAIAGFKKTLEINPLHPDTHLILGSIAADEGKIVQALLCYNVFLMLEPEGDRALNTLAFVNSLAEGNVTRVEKPKGIQLSDGDDFEDIALIIENKVALSSKYKSESKFDFPIIKQNQVLFEKLEYNNTDKGFWMQFYVPFFKALWNEGKFDHYSLLILLSSTNEKVQNTVKKEISTIKETYSWAIDTWTRMHVNHTIIRNGKTINTGYYYADGTLRVIGNSSSETDFVPEGKCELYNNAGSLSAIGKYVNGKQTGKWVYYNNWGIKTKEEEYLNGALHGKAYYYYPDDWALNAEANYNNNLLHGEIKEYYRSGTMRLLDTRANGKRNGKYITYFRNGQKEYEVNYKTDLPDGPFYEYYPDGAKYVEGTYKEGKLEGKYTVYWRNGKVKLEENYLDGETNGKFTEYHENGAIANTGTAKKGFVVGESREFFENGTISSVSTYDELGKLNGLTKYYDYDGKLHYEWEFTKGEISAYRYYNKQGEIIGQGKRKLSKFPFAGYHPDGTKDFEGDYEGSEQNGIWKYYDMYGNIESEVHYKNGLRNGTSIDYYPNGKMHSKLEYTNDLPHGFLEVYYRNGQLLSQGHYVNGSAEGDWYDYTIDGKVKLHRYYLFDEQNGWQTEYDVNGKVTDDSYLEYDNVYYEIEFDTSGNPTDTLYLNKKNIVTLRYHYTGKKNTEGTYSDGVANGPFTWYNAEEKIITKGNFLNGERDGEWTAYFDNGKLKSEQRYNLGQATGVWKVYFENGQLSSETVYYQDEKHGKATTYHDNGKVMIEEEYIHGKSHGEAKYYDETGQLQIIFYFAYGVLNSYSYNNADGNPVPAIPIVKGTGKITAYYANGKKSIEYTIANGYIHGGYTEYHSNGNLWEESIYHDGFYDGPRKVYYANGKLKFETSYLNGDEHGVRKRYSKDGKLNEVISYVFDVKHGLYEKYNETTGKLEKSYIYYNGKVASEK